MRGCFTVAVALLAATSAAAELDENDTSLLTSMVTAALQRETKLDVIAQEDVRRQLALEADRQTVGCGDESCIAEIVGALGARLAVYGRAGELDEGDGKKSVALTLSLFDSTT